MIGSYISQSNYTVQSYDRSFVYVRYSSRHFPAGMCPVHTAGIFMENWDVLIHKTAVPTDVPQNPNTVHSC